MTTLEILKAARAKLAQGWTQGAFARDADGLPVNVCHPKATCWCITGAFRSLPPEADFMQARIALKSSLSGDPQLSEWNDVRGRTQADVIELFDHVIAKLEAA